jgi:hypothetical protein
MEFMLYFSVFNSEKASDRSSEVEKTLDIRLKCCMVTVSDLNLKFYATGDETLIVD